MNQRFLILRGFFLLWFVAILARLYYWQGIKASALQEAAISQYERTTTHDFPRGKILSAEGYPFATNVDAYTLYATPQTVTQNPSTITELLFPLVFTPDEQTATDSNKLAVATAQVKQYFTEKLADKEKKWVRLISNLTKEQKEAVERLQIHGLGFDTYQKRYYPEGSMSAHILGFVGQTNDGLPHGFFGVEGEYNLELEGKKAIVTRQADAVGMPIAGQENTGVRGAQGRTLKLTVARDLQFLLEEKLKAGIQRYEAKEADAIILESKTGKILAMASFPSYDPSHYASQDPTLYKNPLVADGYEPGSTFKVLTVAAGIDSGAITPETQCDMCQAPVKIGKYTIKTWNNEYKAGITMTEALVHSDNTAMVFASQKIGKEKFIEYIKNFGIGKQTGVDLQEETTPSLRDETKWGDIDLATSSFGQGIAVTGIQMVNAVNAIANNGVLLQPYIVNEVQADSQVFTVKPREIRRVISPESAETVTKMMIESASHGDAKWTLPARYSIAGKTGTAQIPVDGHYDEKRTIASFVGFAPADDPKFTMLVRVVEPQTSQWGSETAAPLWFSIAKELFVRFGITEKPTSD